MDNSQPATNAAGESSSEESSWYKDAIIYELHVRTFFDSNADGIGDFPGLTQKLDYLADLGVTALWLLPFYPSPLRDGGYDISDYFAIDPSYGTMRDWRIFLAEAHRRGLRVITELVVNHTSDQHPWFQRARRAAPNSRFRNYYVWTENPDKYRKARIIFKDFEISNWTWDPLARAYYWHRFYSHQPDLNFNCPQVRRAIFRVVDFWLRQGVDGLRLDAVPYLYEREGTSCENLPETHQYLKELRRHVDANFKDRVLLAEANQWPEEAVDYFGQGEGDECQMAFHFPLMPRLFMGIQMEDRVPIVDILEQTPALPKRCQWALFLRNHDELTLEMVTDEERDYMYRVFAKDLKARLNLGIRRRLSPLLGNDRRKIELLKMLLLSMPGTPVLYYGDEIGMGDNIYLGDRNGVRTPMQWNSDKNAGFSRASPQMLPVPVVSESEYHYESVNVEAEQRNENSLLWWTRRLIHLRKRWKPFGRGSLEFILTGNRKVLAYLRRYQGESLLVVANLSRLPQPAELNLSELMGYTPVELSGSVEFSPISGQLYSMTLSAYSAFWFWMRPAVEKAEVEEIGEQEILFEEDWRTILDDPLREDLARALKRFLLQQSWFLSRGRNIETIRIRDVLAIPASRELCLVVLSVDFLQAETEEYALALGFASGELAAEIGGRLPGLVIAKTRSEAGPGIVYDGMGNPLLLQEVLAAISKRRALKGRNGSARTWKSQQPETVSSTAIRAEEAIHFHSSNQALAWNGYFFKLFGRLEEGMNPEIEIGQLLERRGFLNVPPLLGTLEYHSNTGKTMSLGLLGRLIPDGANAWRFTLETLELLLDQVQAMPRGERIAASGLEHPLVREPQLPDTTSEIAGSYGEFARLLGQRTSQLHSALADREEQGFVPEAFTPFYLRSLYQSWRNRIRETIEVLRAKQADWAVESQALALRLIEQQNETLGRLKKIYRNSPHGVRIRCHGRFRLSEVLYTGKDIFIIDFEGDAARPASERRIKRPPTYDLASMLFSFHNAALFAVEKRIASGVVAPEEIAELQAWAEAWAHWVGVAFLEGYGNASPNELLRQPPEDFYLLLNCHLVDRAAKELLETMYRGRLSAEIPMRLWASTLLLWMEPNA